MAHAEIILLINGQHTGCPSTRGRPCSTPSENAMSAELAAVSFHTESGVAED